MWTAAISGFLGGAINACKTSPENNDKACNAQNPTPGSTPALSNNNKASPQNAQSENTFETAREAHLERAAHYQPEFWVGFIEPCRIFQVLFGFFWHV